MSPTAATDARNVLWVKVDEARPPARLKEPPPKDAGRSALIQAAVAAELELLRKFNPREPRDPGGKWSLVGGVKKLAKALTPDQAQAMQDQMLAGEHWTDRQKNAIRDYAAFGYRPMNGILRGKNASSDNMTRAQAKAAIKDTVSAMRPLPQPVLAKRMTSFEAFGLPEPVTVGDILDRNKLGIEKIQSIKRGTVLQERGFMSTSIGPNEGFQGDIQLQLEIPAGTMAAYVASLTSEPDEHELLLAPGVKFEVQDIVVPADGSPPTVSVRVLPPPEAA